VKESDIIDLATKVRDEYADYTTRINIFEPKLRQLMASISAKKREQHGSAILKTLKQLLRTEIVMSHKIKTMKTLTERAKAGKPDLASLKHLLEVQLDVAKLANKQADLINRELDKAIATE